MIKSNELRIGNWVKVDDLPAEQVTLEFFNAMRIAPGSVPFISGIPLTEEWLERLGFQNRCIRVDEYSGMRIDDKGRFELMDYSDGQMVSSWDNRIEFVHQLQNLYFALCGEELTIKQHESRE